MTSPFALSNMSAKDRAKYGAALAKSIAFDAVYNLWQRRSAEGWTRARIASNVGVDEGWLSKQFAGPRNWTMESFGTLVQGLEGEPHIVARAIEDGALDRTNYDAYSEYDIFDESPTPKLPQVPPEKKSGVTGSPNDPAISKLLDRIISPKEPTPVPVV